MKKQNSDVSGIVLLKKHSGTTSFSSLSCVKRALGTTKVGHTGTLDSFADGLLVVLVGSLTHLVPHITNFDKTYLALIEFGSETDTLDPTGQVIKTGRIPAKDELLSVLPKFLGEIEQVPPLYSALHVDGKRASDLAREGKSVELKARKITVSKIELKDFYDNFALVEVSCSKGTYIRSLARDIAKECGTVAHLKELHRMRVGPFSLEDAVSDEAEIRSHLIGLTPEVASLCGMDTFVISKAFVSDFQNGRPLRKNMFVRDFSEPDAMSPAFKSEIALFYPNGKFAGCITRKMTERGEKFSYGFVVKDSSPKPQDDIGSAAREMKIYSWEQIAQGKFNKNFLEKGVALTIGSFDGSHLGHKALFKAVLGQKEKGFVPGVLTFTKSLRGYKNPKEYEGDLVSLSQKIENLEGEGFEFAVVVDFSSDFAKIIGNDFFSILKEKCGLKYLAEGADFHCGYKGATGMQEIAKIAGELNFSVDTIDSVIFEGERVSSSRIRKCVLQKQFQSVQKMLLKPFELDCTGFVWNVEEPSENLKVISAKKREGKLLPPDGTYRVQVIFYVFSQKSGEAQNYRAANSDCTLENGNLRLAFSDNLISGFVRSIKFL